MQPLDVLGFKSLVARQHIERDFLAFIQRLKTPADDGRVMHKNVLTGFLSDETKPLLIVEPLYFATRHTISPEPCHAVPKKNPDTIVASMCMRIELIRIECVVTRVEHKKTTPPTSSFSFMAEQFSTHRPP